MLKMSFRKTLRQEEGKARQFMGFILPPRSDALANFTGGFPATVIGSASRDHICRRNWISFPGVETPRRKLVGNCPYSATQLLLLKKFARHVELAQLEVLGTIVEHVRETAIGPEHLGVGAGKLRNEVEHDVALRGTHSRE